MVSGDNSTRMEAELAQLENELAVEAQARTSLARTKRIVVVMLSATVVLFVLTNLLFFRSEWTGDKIKAGLEKELRELSPFAIQEVNALGKNLVPVYAEEAQTQLQSLMPRISTMLEHEVQALGTDVVESLHEELLASFENLNGKISAELFQSFPQLNDPAVQEEFRERFRQRVERETLALLMDFEKRFKGDIDEVTETLLQFELSDEAGSNGDLRKKFLRLWLRLLDLEVAQL